MAGTACATNCTNGLAGSFTGDVSVTGNLNVSGRKHFKIDHPLDPAKKYLYHASLESSEVLNFYSGNATLDANGETTVQLPNWFEALNRDFRYQLTAIGAAAPACTSRKRFKITGSGLPVVLRPRRFPGRWPLFVKTHGRDRIRWRWRCKSPLGNAVTTSTLSSSGRL